MSTIRLISQGTGAPAAPVPPSARSGNEIQNEVRQAIDAANSAAREASREAARAGQTGRTREIVVGPGGIEIHRAPGIATTPAVWDNGSREVPTGVVDISIGFFAMCAFIAVGWPLARAFGKRLERRAEPAAVSPAMAEQLQRIEQAVDAMSIEVERISESQRFLTKLQSGAAADRLPVPR